MTLASSFCHVCSPLGDRCHEASKKGTLGGLCAECPPCDRASPSRHTVEVSNELYRRELGGIQREIQRAGG